MSEYIYDRLYSQMKFPTIIQDLLDCPGLLRLRDVRMANNQFFAFPAFANSSRYEHSLGVCYLAGICADHMGLSEKDKIELMIAGLYHDVGTPPFAHAMEEVLQAKFDFDHEENLRKLITGTSENYDQDFAQVYLGQSLKLNSFCQSKKAAMLGIDSHRIANIAVGDKTDELSPLINGSAMDLDNIDNICRAVSAMGIMNGQVDFSTLAQKLASSFILKSGKIVYNNDYEKEINQWLLLRDIQYTHIYKSIDDFSYQTMIKRAIHIIGDKEGINGLDKNLWRLTDSEFTIKYLLSNEESKPLMERVLLCKPYPPLALLYVRGEGSTKYINTNIRSIEKEVSQYIYNKVGLDRFLKNDLILANFYPDKRHRWIPEEKWAVKTKAEFGVKQEEGAILGLFTPAKVTGYVTDPESKARAIRHFDRRNLSDLITEVKKLLNGFEVTEYDAEIDRRNSSSHGEYQLGF